jgi:hypothetical protein
VHSQLVHRTRVLEIVGDVFDRRARRAWNAPGRRRGARTTHHQRTTRRYRRSHRHGETAMNRTGSATRLLLAVLVLGLGPAGAAGAQEPAGASQARTPRQRLADDKLFIETRHGEAGGFARYRTWAWIPMDETLASPLLYRNRDLQGWIKGGVERSLAAKGYQSTTYGDADFSVAYQVSVRDVSVVRKQRFRGFSHGYRRDRLARWREVTRIEEMPEGTLILDVVDPDLDAVVWSGSVSGLVTGEVTEAGVAAAVDALLARYPPQ